MLLETPLWLHEIIGNLPGIGAFIVVIGTLIFNNRKNRAEANVIATGAAAVTAKSEAEIFESKFNMLIAGLERRVADAEKQADEERVERLLLAKKLEDCDKLLNAQKA